MNSRTRTRTDELGITELCRSSVACVELTQHFDHMMLLLKVEGLSEICAVGFYERK